jgi:hypothetical protein
MIFSALSDLFLCTVPLEISDDLHTPEIFEKADKFLLLLSRIAPEVPLPTAEELTEDFLSRL